MVERKGVESLRAKSLARSAARTRKLDRLIALAQDGNNLEVFLPVRAGKRPAQHSKRDNKCRHHNIAYLFDHVDQQSKSGTSIWPIRSITTGLSQPGLFNFPCITTARNESKDKAVTKLDKERYSWHNMGGKLLSGGIIRTCCRQRALC